MTVQTPEMRAATMDEVQTFLSEEDPETWPLLSGKKKPMQM